MNLSAAGMCSGTEQNVGHSQRLLGTSLSVGHLSLTIKSTHYLHVNTLKQETHWQQCVRHQHTLGPFGESVAHLLLINLHNFMSGIISKFKT